MDMTTAEAKRFLPQCFLGSSSDSLDLNTESTVFVNKKKAKRKPYKKKLGIADHKTIWKQLKHRVLNVQSELDTKPPTYPAVRATGVAGLRRNARVYMERTRNNIMMIVSLTKRMRGHGDIVPFRYDRVYPTSSVPMAIKKLETIEIANRDLAKNIVEIVSIVDSGLKEKQSKQAKKSRKLTQPFPMPLKGLAKYEEFNVKMPLRNMDCWYLLRPQIYFDLYLKASKPIGQIVIELCTEAAPVVVQELVKACKAKKHNRLLLRRVFPKLWFDVQLRDESNPDIFLPMEYDAKVIDHGATSYVLSFSKEYLRGFNKQLTFSISFRPLKLVNGSRIGFGRVVKGTKIIDCLQSYGTKNGKLSRDIIFSDCGVL